MRNSTDKVSLDVLEIEITPRRCNMRCHHCLRGGVQRIDIRPEYITGLLRNVDSIRILVITGDEPSLNVPGIRFMLKELKRLGIPVESFDLTTNGSRSSISKEFMDVCVDLYEYQNYRIESGNPAPYYMLYMSDDTYHDQTWHWEVENRLSAFRFFTKRNNNYTRRNLLKEGRCNEGDKVEIYPWRYDEEKQEIDGDVYLNAKGDLLSNCNLSYRRQNKEKVCHYTQFMQHLDYADCS